MEVRLVLFSLCVFASSFKNAFTASEQRDITNSDKKQFAALKPCAFNNSSKIVVNTLQ